MRGSITKDSDESSSTVKVLYLANGQGNIHPQNLYDIFQ